MKLLIDGDPIVYRIGFACQSKDKETGLATADPVPYTLHSCKLFVDNMIKTTKANSYKVFLSGGNGKGVDKPIHYQLVRDYLVKKYNAQVVTGMEADDALALCQTEDTCIATIDKDLLMVPGSHYNYAKLTWATVTPKEGEFFFYKQMLTGDRVDNITGIRGIGEKKADKLLSNTPRKDWDKTIINLYIKEFDTGFQRCVENTQLLWMLQRNRQMPMEFI